MAEQTEQAAGTDVSPLRSWIIRHPIATFLVLVYATSSPGSVSARGTNTSASDRKQMPI